MQSNLPVYTPFWFLAEQPRKNKDKCMFLLYIHAISVANGRESKMRRESCEQKTDFTLKVCFDFSFCFFVVLFAVVIRDGAAGEGGLWWGCSLPRFSEPTVGTLVSMHFFMKPQ